MPYVKIYPKTQSCPCYMEKKKPCLLLITVFFLIIRNTVRRYTAKWIAVTENMKKDQRIIKMIIFIKLRSVHFNIF